MNTREYKGKKISFNNNDIIINGKKLKVVEDYEYTYKILKTCIKAINGAEGLKGFMFDCIDRSFATCWVDRICEQVALNGKEN